MSEYLEPQFDWVVMDLIDHEERTESGLVIPKPGTYESLKTDRERREHKPDRDNNANRQTRDTDRYRVLAVGPGAYTDVMDEMHDRTFLRKPVCCEVGDVVLVQAGAFPIMVSGVCRYMTHDFNILAIIVNAGTKDEAFVPQNDYIFSKQADGTQKSSGGIVLIQDSDPTGNKAMPDRWEAIGVGEGPWCLVTEKGKPAAFARRPMSVQVGDQFAFEGRAFLVNAGGASMCCTQSYQTAAIFRQEAA